MKLTQELATKKPLATRFVAPFFIDGKNQFIPSEKMTLTAEDLPFSIVGQVIGFRKCINVMYEILICK